MSKGLPHREDGCPPEALFIVTPFVMFLALIALLIFEKYTAPPQYPDTQVRPPAPHESWVDVYDNTRSEQ